MEKFSAISYARPDMRALAEEIKTRISDLRNAKSYEAARSAYLALENADVDANTMRNVAHIRSTINTADPFYEEEVRYLQGEGARMMPLYREVNQALLESPFRKEFETEFGAYLFHNLEEQNRLLDPSIIEDKIQESEWVQKYQKVTALCHTEFRGEDCNFYGLLRHMQSTDRAERKEAFEAWADMYNKIAPQLEAQYAELVKIRAGMARKLGMDSYITMAYLNKRRYNYGPEDVQRFRKQVKDVIVPACEELFERQRRRLGIDTLFYYDEALVFPEGNELPQGNREEMVSAAQVMYREMSPETGEFFDFMVEHELFDLETKPNKRMGGYCTFLPKYKAPFIFSNFMGRARMRMC